MKKKYLIFAIMFLITFIFISALVVTGITENINKSITSAFYSIRSNALTVIMKAFTFAGEWIAIVVATLLLIIIPITRKNVGLPLALILVVTISLNIALKNIFKIPRPDETQHLVHASGYGFPSGHSMASMSFFLFVGYRLRYFSKHKSSKIIITIISIISPMLVGLSRLYLGVHSFTDVIGGFSLSTSIYFFAIFIEKHIIDKNKKREVQI